MFDSLLLRTISFRGRRGGGKGDRCGVSVSLCLLFRVLPAQDFHSVAWGYFLTFDIVFCSYDVVFYSCDWDLFRRGVSSPGICVFFASCIFSNSYSFSLISSSYSLLPHLSLPLSGPCILSSLLSLLSPLSHTLFSFLYLFYLEISPFFFSVYSIFSLLSCFILSLYSLSYLNVPILSFSSLPILLLPQYVLAYQFFKILPSLPFCCYMYPLFPLLSLLNFSLFSVSCIPHFVIFSFVFSPFQSSLYLLYALCLKAIRSCTTASVKRLTFFLFSMYSSFYPFSSVFTFPLSLFPLSHLSSLSLASPTHPFPFLY